MSRLLIVFLFLLLLLAACSGDLPTPTVIQILTSVTRAPTPPVTQADITVPPVPTATATPIPTPIPVKDPDFYLTIDPGTPAEIVDVAAQVAMVNPQHFSLATERTSASNSVRLVVEDGATLAQWVYAVAAPFATIPDDTTMAELMAGWQSGHNHLGSLILDEKTAETLSVSWGPPGAAVTILPEDAIKPALWSNRPSWTIIPFHQLSPDLKVLRIDGMSPVGSAFNLDAYPLTIDIGLNGDQAGVTQLQSRWSGPTTNRDALKITTVAMSGVTALGRATAYQMEIQGITTPGVVVGPVLQTADIAHISHEVPFAANCPYPNPIGDPIFCARDGYLALLLSLGTDLVELTGNHVNDWGPENFVHSMDLYDQAGLETFGGGRNLTEALQPALYEHNGNKIAFIGCNPVGPAYAWATNNSAGSAPCNYEALYNQIEELKGNGYLVIATLQYSEFYHYAPTTQQRVDFRAVADAGAAAVSGSQGHHAQGFDLYNGAFIHYGLGNLFFDQMDMLGTRQSFIDTYSIYDGRLINVDLFTSLIENYCCPRAMSVAEREQLLQTVFRASGW